MEIEQVETIRKIADKIKVGDEKTKIEMSKLINELAIILIEMRKEKSG